MKFKVGDRVRAYSGGLAKGYFDARVTQITSEGLLILDEYGVYHPKQCRRLVKTQRRRAWLLKSCLSNQAIFEPPNFPENWIEFVEVRKK